MGVKMHDGQLEIGEADVRGLLAEQFPAWREMPVRRVQGVGTVNAIFRIGDGYAARFPLERADAPEMERRLVREMAALEELATVATVPSPVPVSIGAPGRGYPLPWTIQTWIPGEIATPDATAHSRALAHDLVELIAALRSADMRGRAFSGEGRGGCLQDSDEWMATCFAESEGMLPVPELRVMWSRLRALPDAPGLAMTHGDLIPANLLLDEARLCGLLDGGGFGPADPSLDLVVAWHLLDADARAVMRDGLRCGELEWRRGAAWAFQQSMGLVWYYTRSNPAMSMLGRSTLRRLLDDEEISAP